MDNFILVAELRSIAEAARRLDLAPATLTQRLRTLEASLGTPLLVRSGRNVQPNAAGLRILESARTVMREVRQLQSSATATALPAGPLHLGATPAALAGMVPLILKAWADQYPNLQIRIEPGPTQALYAQVLAGDLDAAVLVHPAFDLPKTCGWHGLRVEPLILLTHAALRVTDPIATLAREPYLRYARSAIAGRMADDYIRQHGIHPRAQFELDGIENIAMLVAQGLGVSVLPDWFSVAAPNPLVRRWRLPPPVPARQMGIAWLRAGARAALAQAFVDVARTIFPLDFGDSTAHRTQKL